jgi:hypothetical protein
MSSPAWMAWNRKTEWIASRTGLLPRKHRPDVIPASDGQRLDVQRGFDGSG